MPSPKSAWPTAKAAVKKFTAWSYSRFGTYRQCPLKAKLSALDKIEEPKNDAMARGNQIHQEAEDFLKGKISLLPVSLKLFGVKMKQLKAKHKKSPDQVIIEEMWVFRSDWTETVWNDWNGAWLRIKMDCAELIFGKKGVPPMLDINDWKTGKFSPRWNVGDYMEQMELYALGGLLKFGAEYPDIQVRPRLVYLDHAVVFPDYEKPITIENPAKVYTMADLEPLKKKWTKETKQMLNDTKFVPKPNDKCKWCFYRKDNLENGGGQCKY